MKIKEEAKMRAKEGRREFLETSNEREEGRKGERERRREMKCFRASKVELEVSTHLRNLGSSYRVIT